MEPTYPILEFDPDRGAILNPAATREGTHLPERVFFAFSMKFSKRFTGRGGW